jgi:NTP pyrophosphatase (non-canonical NTP hydrolase)
MNVNRDPQQLIDRYKAAYAAANGEEAAAKLELTYHHGWFTLKQELSTQNVRFNALLGMTINLEMRARQGDTDTVPRKIGSFAMVAERLRQRDQAVKAEIEQMEADFGMNHYQKLAMRTAMKPDGGKPVPEYLALSLTGEAGEIAELIKKAVYHGHRLNRNRVADELGDVLWYVAVMADRYGWSLSDIAERNIAKLEQRYPDGFSQEASRNRNPVTENPLHADHESIPEKGYFRTAGKLGSWARRGMRGERYLAVSAQGTSGYRRIVDARLPDDGTWRHVLVQVEGSDTYSRHGCNTNVYEKIEYR